MAAIPGKVLRFLGGFLFVAFLWAVAYAIVEAVWFFAIGSRIGDDLRFILAVVLLVGIGGPFAAFLNHRRYIRERAEYRAGLRDTISE